jgi:hypothetical protein
MSRGDGRHITTGAGFPMARVGRGGQGRWRCIPHTTQSGRQRTFHSSDGEAAGSEWALDSDLVSVTSAGCRAVLVTGTTRGTDATAADTTW